jgi:hypothetical protein
MKKLLVLGGFVLTLSFFSALPADACETCEYRGYICNGGWCSPLYVCTTQPGFCTQCYDWCAENADQGCFVSFPCQWAAKPLELDQLRAASSLSLLLNSCPAT